MPIQCIRIVRAGEFDRSYKQHAELVEDVFWGDGDINRIAVSPTFFREFVRQIGSTGQYARVGKKMAVQVVLAANRPALVYCDPVLEGMAFVAQHNPNNF